MSPSSTSANRQSTRKILLLHGDRQTGELLLGRISSLKRKLLKPRQYQDSDDMDDTLLLKDQRIEIVAPDGPYQWVSDPSVHHLNNSNRNDNDNCEEEDQLLLRTWWYRNGDEYQGLEESLNMLHKIWLNDEGFEGILGFSRGGRLAHLIAMLHEASSGRYFPKLNYVICASAYGHVPLPSNFPPELDGDISNGVIEWKDISSILPLQIKSLHIMGIKDRLIPVEASMALLPSYTDPVVHEFDGGHHVPMRAADVRAILKFIDSSSVSKSAPTSASTAPKPSSEATNAQSSQHLSQKDETIHVPDEEHAQLQIDECESMSLIFPDEFELLSLTENGDRNIIPGETNYQHPISYTIRLKPPPEQLEGDAESIKLWPKSNISLKVEYNHEYPDVLPSFSLRHDMNLLEFKLAQEKACLDAVKDAANAESGMPCVMSCVYAAREFFESGGLQQSSLETTVQKDSNDHIADDHDDMDDDEKSANATTCIKSSSRERIEQCKLEGLQISYDLAGYVSAPVIKTENEEFDGISEVNESFNNGKGGSWKYTIGLVGKPSAGKSTFFNAASAFARQKGGDSTDEEGVAIGGATMAPHPFTTIDPNVGYCLVPVPESACPENDCKKNMKFSSSHGRDSYGRRLVPVMLKDVAGLVPGAYKGRGRGNKFLDDLLDADVLIHVLDSSGTADTEGNKVVVDGVTGADVSGSNPLKDIAWVHNELIEWIVSNLMRRWDTIIRRGRQKLVGMFSGYKQSEAFVWNVLLRVESVLAEKEGRDRALDNLGSWDEGDIYRLVTAFLGVRFPTCLALNKYDLPSSSQHCNNILENLPLHGAHVGIPMSADQEMKFVRHHIYSAIAPKKVFNDDSSHKISPPTQVWSCLQSAMKLRQPVFVFPVLDMEKYSPLPGMFNYATRDSSLPSLGMISCLEASGGEAPSNWDIASCCYYPHPNDVESSQQTLRDCLVMKPNSTVEDVYECLKRLGALGGEFVRAEAVKNIGDKPKLVKKDELVGFHNRIIKIMTTKRREWQRGMHQSSKQEKS